MKIAFYQLFGEKSQGGLDVAVSRLKTRLELSGVDVRVADPRVDLSGVNLVHFHGLWQPAWRAVAKSCLSEGKPYLISPHGMLEPWSLRHKAWKKWPYYHLFEKNFLGNASCLLATSRMEAGNILKLLPGRKVEMIPLGLPSIKGPDYQAARKRLGWDRKVILFLSRVHPKKGLHMLLEALKELHARGIRDYKLVIVGGGERRYLSRLQSYCRRHARSLPEIEWTGEIWGEARWDYFQGADLFCLPSYSENFGLAVLESLQVGTPVLTTDQTPWGDCKGQAGCYICSPDVKSLCRNLEDWFQSSEWDEGERDVLATSIHEAYRWDVLVPRYLALYKELLG